MRDIPLCHNLLYVKAGIGRPSPDDTIKQAATLQPVGQKIVMWSYYLGRAPLITNDLQN